MKLATVVLAALLALRAEAEVPLTADDVVARAIEARGGAARLKAITSLRLTGKAAYGGGDGGVTAFTPVDSVMIPTGEIRPVAGTPFDFNTPHAIGERIGENYDQLILGRGYDHNYILDNKDEVDATVYEPVSGRVLEVITDQPGMQLYTGNFLDGKQKGHGGKAYNYRSGLCLEADHYPDSPNHPDFPTTVLNPGETFKSTTIYRFSVK